MEHTEKHNHRKEYDLCISPDDFLFEKCIWIAELSDGTVVYQDDYRPGVEIPSAWLRLSKYISENPSVCIKQLKLQFRDHIEYIEKSILYYYSRGMAQSITSVTRRKEHHSHVVGTLDEDGNILCKWWKSPEILITEERIRKIVDCNSKQLISGTTVNF
jgi:hypothetical protein